jgi:hypothetical protein
MKLSCNKRYLDQFLTKRCYNATTTEIDPEAKVCAMPSMISKFLLCLSHLLEGLLNVLLGIAYLLPTFP